MSKKLHKRVPASLPVLLWLMMLAFLPAQLSARDFTYTYEGQTLTYTVLDETAKTVSTKEGEEWWSTGNAVSGDLVIPSEVSDGTNTYSVTEIGKNAFYECSGLTSVIIPNSVTTIGGDAFYNCSGLTSVIIPNSVTSIGDSAFKECSGLKKSAYPSNLSNPFKFGPFPSYGTVVEYPEYGTYLFEDGYIWTEDKTGLYFVPFDVEGEFVIPNSVTSIGDGAFSGCSGLTSVIIPNSVTEIGKNAFYECGGLTSVIIPNSVTTIGKSVFDSCYGLKKSAYPSNLGNPFGYGHAVEYPAYETYSFEDGYIWTEDKTGLYFVPFDIEGEFVIPNSVTSIGDGAFSGCYGLTSVTIPSSVTSIGDGAFSGCSGLTSVTIPTSVTSIDDRAFINCSGLTSVIIPNSVKTFGRDTFYGCSGLIKSAYPSNLGNPFWYGHAVEYPADGTYSFENGYIWTEDKTGLYFVPFDVEGNFVIPTSVTSIGKSTFYGCSGLTSVTIPNSVTSIGEKAFYKCTGLTSVTIPNSVTSIGSEAFKDCASLTSVIIPNSVTTIGRSAFDSCYGLKKVAYPSNLSNPFQSWYEITVIYPASGTYSFEDGYIWTEDKTGLYFVPLDVKGEFVIPNSVTTIGERAFDSCSELTSVIIPNSVKTVGDNAFNGCYPEKSAYPSNLSNPFQSWMTTVKYPAEGTYLFEDGYIWSEDKTGLYFVPLYVEGKYIIPSTVTDIYTNAFTKCALTEVEAVSETVPEMAADAFSKLYSTCQLTVPANCFADYMSNSNWYLFENINGASALDNGNFKYRINSSDATAVLIGPAKTMTEATILAKVSLDNTMYTVKAIGANAFQNGNLTKVTFRNGLEVIGQSAFQGNKLTEIELPESLKEIGSHAFDSNTALKSVAIGAGVKTIGDYAFNGDALTEITIPDAVESVGNYAFASNTALKSVAFGTSVKAIGDYAFNGDALNEITIPDAVESIGNYAFASNTDLKSAAIGTGVKAIGDYAFNGDGLTEITIPDAVETIGAFAFASNAALKSATIGAGVKTIGEKAFYASSLAEITIPCNVDSICASAFDGNSSLANAIINEGTKVINIDKSAFGSSLKNLTLGRNYEGNLPYSSNITFGNLFTDQPSASGRSGLKSVTFGTGITEIPANAFKGCSLTEVVVPSNVTTIGESAFANNELTNVIIGCGTAEIGHNAFADNNSIATINVTAIEPPVASDDVFSTQNAQLNVLKASREAYENAVCWYQFEGTDLVPITVFKILNEPVPANMPSRAAANGAKQLQLTVAVEPANASLKDCITWSSSNPEVATVDNNGLVTFTDATEGTSAITAHTLYDGVVSTLEVSAQGEGAGVDDVYIGEGTDNKRPNDIYNLQGVCLKRNASQEDIDALTPGLYIIAGKKVLVK